MGNSSGDKLCTFLEALDAGGVALDGDIESIGMVDEERSFIPAAQ
jgi:hypothetical protein